MYEKKVKFNYKELLSIFELALNYKFYELGKETWKEAKFHHLEKSFEITYSIVVIDTLIMKKII